jgi:hypothetical protein
MTFRNRYSRGIVDLPSVFIAVGWVGLWFLWPSFDRWAPRPDDRPAPCVAFVRGLTVEGKPYMRPDLMGRPMRVEVPGEDFGAGMLGSLLSQPERHPRYLERDDGIGWATTNGVAASRNGVLVELGSYRPIWRAERIFLASRTEREMRLSSEVSGDLKKQGFEAPAFTEEELKRFDKPWQVVVYVDVNAAGQPAHVLLETGCEDSKINATVVRAMYRGKVSKPGAACSGRVTLSYGLP